MKIFIKIVLTLFLIIFISPVTFCAGIQVTQFFPANSSSERITIPVNISLLAQGNWILQILPLEQYIFNQNGYRMPITNFSLFVLGKSQETIFSQNTPIQILSSQVYGMNNINLMFSLKPQENYRAGNYSTDIKITLIDSNHVVTEKVFNLKFSIPEKSYISFSNQTLRLSMEKSKILQKKSEQHLVSPLVVYVKSNSNWKLYIKKTGNTENSKLKFQIKPLSADEGIVLYKNDYVQMTDTNTELLASGKATFNDLNQSLDTKSINIDYKINGPEND